MRFNFLRNKVASRYRRDGFAIDERLLKRSEVSEIQCNLYRITDKIIEGWKSRGMIGAYDPKDTERYLKAWIEAGQPQQSSTPKNDEFLHFIRPFINQRKHILNQASKFLRSKKCELIDITFYRSKFPYQSNTSIPWHQDSQCLEKLIPHKNFVTLWIPLVDVSAQNSCLEVASLSSKSSTLATIISEETEYVCMLEADVLRLKSIKKILLKAGDGIWLSPNTPHRSLDNMSDKIRWSIDLRFQPKQ